MRNISFGQVAMIILKMTGKFCRPYDGDRVQVETGKTKEEQDVFFSTVNELNDISCFTYMASDFMWREYANCGNGFCMEFDLDDSDKFFPVIYLDKNIS